jgi:hypothetical protein
LSAIFDSEENPVAGVIKKFSVISEKKILAQTQSVPALDIVPDIRPTEQPIALQKIQWMKATDQEEKQIFLNKPQLDLRWLPLAQTKINEYRVVLKNADDTASAKQEVISTIEKLSVPVQKAGRYIASIEGLDEKRNVIATSEDKTIVLKELEVLKAPHIVGKNILTTNAKGDLKVKWEALKGAQKYRVYLINQANQKKQIDIITNRALNQDKSMISKQYQHLMPGLYELQVVGIDLAGRLGELTKRQVEVPEISDLAAPKIKKPRVK